MLMFQKQHVCRNYWIKSQRLETLNLCNMIMKGAQWLSGRVLDSWPKGRGFEPHRRLCVVSLSKNINPSLVLVQPRKTSPFITERLLMGRKESNKQTNKQYDNGVQMHERCVGFKNANSRAKTCVILKSLSCAHFAARYCRWRQFLWWPKNEYT